MIYNYIIKFQVYNYRKAISENRVIIIQRSTNTFLLNSPTFLIPKGLMTFSAARVRPKAKDSLRSRPEAVKAIKAEGHKGRSPYKGRRPLPSSRSSQGT